MPEEIKRSIFKQPFVTSKPSGRGLGMFISNKIMELNGGKIELTEKDGQVTFTIHFGEKQP